MSRQAMWRQAKCRESSEDAKDGLERTFRDRFPVMNAQSHRRRRTFETSQYLL